MKKPSKTALGLIGVGLFFGWAGNYMASSFIADLNKQELRDLYYEGDFDPKYAEELNKNIKWWKTNAKFPFANKIVWLFKQDEQGRKPRAVPQPKMEDVVLEENVEAEYYHDHYKLKFENGEFLHYEYNLVDKFDSLTLYKGKNQKTLVDNNCDGEVNLIIEGDSKKGTLGIYKRGENGEGMFLEADYTLKVKKKALDIDHYHQIWLQKIRHME